MRFFIAGVDLAKKLSQELETLLIYEFLMTKCFLAYSKQSSLLAYFATLKGDYNT